MDFYSRRKELGQLSAIQRARNAQLVALYGRRRIGKTALLTHWLDRQKGSRAMWTAQRSTSKWLLESASRSLAHLAGTEGGGI